MFVSECKVAIGIREEMQSAINERVKAESALGDLTGSQSMLERERRFRESEKAFWVLFDKLCNHRRACPECLSRNSEDSWLCNQGTRLLAAFGNTTAAAVRDDDLVSNDTASKSKVIEALEAFQRHKRQCSECR